MVSPTDTLNTKYLHFDAFSIKDAIKQFLVDDPNHKFTDYMYEGSNLSIIIDLVALMYQCLIYNLNNTASESMFSDTQLYNNINRIVKLIGYNPRGYTTSIAELLVENRNNITNNSILPKYSFINTNKKDSHGNPIYYSTIYNTIIEPNSKSYISIYNGIWKLYNVINVAKGSAYETFTLNLTSNPTQGKFIAYPHINLYVKTSTGEVKEWTRVDNIYESENSQYTNTDTVFELRLTDSGAYSIKCGDGIHGAKFPVNSQLYVMYLQSNGQEGAIDANDINALQFNLNAGSLGLSLEAFNDIYGSILGATFTNIIDYVNKFNGTNQFASSSAKIEETVDEIRENAPLSLSTANRLVTAADVATWLRLNYSGEILDVAVMNNWEYISKFYGWLYNLGNYIHKNPTKYINSSILSKYDLSYTDAADANSIYCWIKTLGNTQIQHSVLRRASDNIKMLTSNLIFLPVLTCKFAICAAPADYVKKYYLDSTSTFDPTDENYIEITVDDTLIYSPILIKEQVKSAITAFFINTNFKLGDTVNINTLLNSILSIPGITNVKTCFIPREDLAFKYSIESKPGLYFASWTSDVIDAGDDLQVTSADRHLEVFQFPELFSNILDNKIKIITTNSNIAKAN